MDTKHPQNTPAAASTPHKPGVCLDWSEIRPELPTILGNETQLQQIWQDIDSLAYTYIWHLLVSF